MWPWENRSEHITPDSRKVLYLFPDNNFFIQCLLPEQLDWSSFTDFDEVILIVTRPVQKEIDWQKNRGGDRLGRRARKIASVLRSIVQNSANELTVNDASPVVKLRLRVDLRPRQSARRSARHVRSRRQTSSNYTSIHKNSADRFRTSPVW